MIESFWRSLKHQWLYLNRIDSFENLNKLISFYIEQHNTVMPHYAFQGQTPDEIYFGQGDTIPEQLKDFKIQARQERIAANRALICTDCGHHTQILTPDIDVNPSTNSLDFTEVLQMHQDSS